MTMEQLSTYSLAAAQSKYGGSMISIVPFAISADGKRLAASIWIKDADGLCDPKQTVVICGDHVLGIFDLSSGKLIARTSRPEAFEPEFAFFRKGGAEIVSNFGSDIVILNAADLSVKRELTTQSREGGPGSKIVFAALSEDGSSLAVLYFSPQANQTAGDTLGEVVFRLYGLNPPAMITSCTVAKHTPYPSFQIALAPNKKTFLSDLASGRGIGEYDSRTCALLGSWHSKDVPERGELSPDGQYIAIVFGGLYPKLRLAVFSRTGEKPLWSLPAHSINDMEWPLSISPDSRFLAISTDRYGESWWDTFREMSHVNDPGIEVRALPTGRRLASARFVRRTRSTWVFTLATRLVRFISANEIATVGPGPEVHLYKLVPKRKLRQ